MDEKNRYISDTKLSIFMSSKSDFSYFSLVFDDKRVIESTNIKRKALELVHQKKMIYLMKINYLIAI